MDDDLCLGLEDDLAHMGIGIDIGAIEGEGAHSVADPGTNTNEDWCANSVADAENAEEESVA